MKKQLEEIRDEGKAWAHKALTLFLLVATIGFGFAFYLSSTTLAEQLRANSLDKQSPHMLEIYIHGVEHPGMRNITIRSTKNQPFVLKAGEWISAPNLGTSVRYVTTGRAHQGRFVLSKYIDGDGERLVLYVAGIGDGQSVTAKDITVDWSRKSQRVAANAVYGSGSMGVLPSAFTKSGN